MQTLLSTRPTANNNFAMPLPTNKRQKLTIETLERGMKYVQSLQKRHQRRLSGVFIVNSEHI